MILDFSIGDIADYVTNLKNFLIGIHDYIKGLFNVIPDPFFSIFMIFAVIILAIIIIRVIRG